MGNKKVLISRSRQSEKACSNPAWGLQPVNNPNNKPKSGARAGAYTSVRATGIWEF
jgi:hypothetical protein